MTTQLFHQVERVYGLALLELAEEAKSVEALAAEARQLGELLAAEPDVIRLLSNRILGLEQRDEICVRLFQGKLSDLLFRFVRVLVRKNRFDESPGIFNAFLHLVDERYGIINVQAIVANPIDQDSSQRITARISELTGRQAKIQQTLDAAMIGGIKLRVADELIDGSVLTQVRLIKEQLIEAGREKARTSAGSFIQE